MCSSNPSATGHTIRLLELPAERSQSIDAASAGSGQTCIGPAAAIQDAKYKYERALAALRNPTASTFIFVPHPEAISIRETQRTIGELSKLDIENYCLIINGLIPPEGMGNPLFAARADMQYFDLFDTACPPIPPGSQLALVLVHDQVVSSGGKISVPLIRKRLEAEGIPFH